MSKKGGLSHKIYVETRGMKVSGGETVKCGAMLTRQGDKWKPGINVLGRMHLSAACAGEIYFTRKRNRKNGKIESIINVRPAVEKA